MVINDLNRKHTRLLRDELCVPSENSELEVQYLKNTWVHPHTSLGVPEAHMGVSFPGEVLAVNGSWRKGIASSSGATDQMLLLNT